MNNKKINEFKKYLIVFSLLFAIAILIKTVQYTNRIELTQLKNNSPKQMMGYLIKTKKDKIIMIDGGITDDTQNVVQQILKNGGKVDYWFITHPHIDHMGAFLEIANNTDIQIGKIYVTYNDLEWYKKNANERENESENVEKFINTLKLDKFQNKVKNVQMNEKIDIENIHIQILGIANPEITTGAINNSSMIIQMKVNDKTILFLGDSQEESGNKLLKNQEKKLKADIVQMAHHGQKGVSKNVYEKIKPEICLWPTPEWLWNNDIGNGEDSGSFKTKETREWMKELNVEKNIIEKDGNITINIL